MYAECSLPLTSVFIASFLSFCFFFSPESKIYGWINKLLRHAAVCQMLSSDLWNCSIFTCSVGAVRGDTPHHVHTWTASFEDVFVTPTNLWQNTRFNYHLDPCLRQRLWYEPACANFCTVWSLCETSPLICHSNAYRCFSVCAQSCSPIVP